MSHTSSKELLELCRAANTTPEAYRMYTLRRAEYELRHFLEYSESKLLPSDRVALQDLLEQIALACPES